VSDLITSEREKYEKVFGFPGYGSVGHGLKIAPYLLQRAKGRGVLGDFGCGRGASFPPYIDAGFTIQPVDHVMALAPQWRQHERVLPVALCNLWADALPMVDYGICTDVMEHIPEPHVGEVIANIKRTGAKGVLWSVCHVEDVWGKRIGSRLHLTVQEHAWWMKKFLDHWPVLETLRTQHGNTIYWTASDGNLA
jgi:hypothetical protein